MNIWILLLFIIAILGLIFSNRDRNIRKEKFSDVLVGITVTCAGFVIAYFITLKSDEESKRKSLISYLSLTKENYSNYLRGKNLGGLASNMSLRLDRLGGYKVQLEDSINYTHLDIPDLYQRFLTDEAIYRLLTDEMKNDILRFREQNLIFKLQFDNLITIEERISFLLNLTFKFDQQIRMLDLELDYQSDRIDKRKFIEKRDSLILENLTPKARYK